MFSDREFVELLRDLAHLRLLDFRLLAFNPTNVGELEFAVVLERIDSSIAEPARTAMILTSLPDLEPTSTERSGLAKVTIETLSPREIGALRAKRTAMRYARSLPRRRRASARTR